MSTENELIQIFKTIKQLLMELRNGQEDLRNVIKEQFLTGIKKEEPGTPEKPRAPKVEEWLREFIQDIVLPANDWDDDEVRIYLKHLFEVYIPENIQEIIPGENYTSHIGFMYGLINKIRGDLGIDDLAVLQLHMICLVFVSIVHNIEISELPGSKMWQERSENLRKQLYGTGQAS